MLSVDAFTLRALLMITGPVEVDGAPVGADAVVEDLLHDQYSVFAATGTTEAAQAARRDRAGAVASAAMDGLAGDIDVDFEDLDVLAAAASGRHLMVWSKDRSNEEAFEMAGLAGRMPEDGLLLSVVNRSGNKLDWFVGVGATMSVDPERRGRRGGGSSAPHERRRSRGAEVRPGPVSRVRSRGGPVPRCGHVDRASLRHGSAGRGRRRAGAGSRWGPPGGRDACAGGRGGAADVVFRFRLPPGVHHVQVIPAARARFAGWTYADAAGAPIQQWEDITPRVLDWTP